MKNLIILLLLALVSCGGPRKDLYVYKKEATSLGLDDKRFIYIDMSIHSGKNRLFVYDFKKKKVVYSCPVMSGLGGKNKKNIFSNEIRSFCSSKGRYKLKHTPTKSNNYWLKYTLHGLDGTNSNAKRRGVVLHPSSYVPTFESYPKKIGYSKGCPSVSYLSFFVISSYIGEKDMLLIIR